MRHAHDDVAVRPFGGVVALLVDDLVVALIAAVGVAYGCAVIGIVVDCGYAAMSDHISVWGARSHVLLPLRLERELEH